MAPCKTRSSDHISKLEEHCKTSLSLFSPCVHKHHGGRGHLIPAKQEESKQSKQSVDADAERTFTTTYGMGGTGFDKII